MAIDPYASCPCGSGKKFKWCCQDIHSEIETAYKQHNAGQHESALQTIAGVVAKHPGNPEAWGRQAQLQFLNGKIEEAEQSLDQAFAINPNYPFGFLVRGLFRQQEGELVGALLLFRKAAEAYSHDAHEPLAYIYELIADLELRFNRPIAAHAALLRAFHLNRDNKELQQAIDTLFGQGSRLPECARREYSLLAPPNATIEWKNMMAGASTGKFGDARKAFQAWTEQHPEDAAAWYNLGLVLGWLGENADAVAALGKYTELEKDERKAGAAWTLAELLRCGQGMEQDADYVEYRYLMTVIDHRPLVTLIQHWEQSKRLIGLRSDPEQGMLTAIVLDEAPALVLSGASSPPARLAAYLLVAGNLVQLWHPNAESVEKVLNEVRQRLGPAAGEPQRSVGPIHFGDVVAEALLFPTAPTTELDAEAKMREHATRYFEDVWIHRSLKGLSGVPPIDATGSPMLRRRLRGIIQFIQDCSAGATPRLYDFDRLRRKLGLDEAAPQAGPPQSEIAETIDVSAMSVAELSALEVVSLAEGDLEHAFRTALQLDARELASRFAKAIVARPATSGDRWAVFQHLIQEAQLANDYDGALSLVDDGEKSDCEANEGRRRNDYELRRGRLLAKAGRADEARDVFDRLLARIPENTAAAGAAAESMLGAKRGKDALQFAEQGLAQARAQNNRDTEGYFLELQEAAKKLGT